jgi:hypothetical protein
MDNGAASLGIAVTFEGSKFHELHRTTSIWNRLLFLLLLAQEKSSGRVCKLRHLHFTERLNTLLLISLRSYSHLRARQIAVTGPLKILAPCCRGLVFPS